MRACVCVWVADVLYLLPCDCVCRVSVPGSQMMLRRLREYGAEQVRRARARAGKGRILCLPFLFPSARLGFCTGIRSGFFDTSLTTFWPYFADNGGRRRDQPSNPARPLTLPESSALAHVRFSTCARTRAKMARRMHAPSARAPAHAAHDAVHKQGSRCMNAHALARSCTLQM